jgi:Lytic transglycolase
MAPRDAGFAVHWPNFWSSPYLDRFVRGGGDALMISKLLRPEVRRFPTEKTVKSVLFSLVALLLSEAPSYAYHHQTNDDFGHDRASIVPNKAVIIGKASWYGRAAAGQRTATGERLDPNELTAACRKLPLETQALVTNLENRRSVYVRINDCGPYTRGRQIDVSKAAAEKLAMVDRGTAPVKIQSIAPPPRPVYCSNQKVKAVKPHSRRSRSKRASLMR